MRRTNEFKETIINDGTNIGLGVEEGINELNSPNAGQAGKVAKYLILLTDGIGQYYNDLTNTAINSNITIYTIGLGDGVDEHLLNDIASKTGGQYYKAEVAAELTEIFKHTSDKTIDFNKDSDKDGISDYYEKLMAEGKLTKFNGMPCKVDLNNPDTDGDGLKDGEEVLIKEYRYREKSYASVQIKSDPTVVDTDADGYNDFDDLRPKDYFIVPVVLLHGREDSSYACFGVKTNVHSKNGKSYNNHYGSSLTENGLDYTAVNTQK